jgi:hypothetical protein
MHSFIPLLIFSIPGTGKLIKMANKPVGDRDYEVRGMGSFGEYKLYGKST